ncbi:MAG: DNA-processing protein DprA [Oscillospiraceae bacterium]
MSALKFWIWLASCRRVGARTAGMLLEHFGSPEAVFFAEEEEFKKIEGLGKAEIDSLIHKNLIGARKILAECENRGFRVITINDAEYPARLKNISNPPIILYVGGRLPAVDEEAAVAVAGTRDCTPYGIKTAERIGYEIAKAGGLVVSGLARGIDSAATRGALRAGGRVVGVIGSGLDVVYPPQNRALFNDVMSTGAIISEYPPGTEAYRSNFPARNRILSGISVGVVIIEAPRHSGALITAARALEQGRDVFSVPGNVDAAACEGSNRLLLEGAIPAVSGFDIMEEYMSLYPEKLGRAGSIKTVPLDPLMTKKLINRELAGENAPLNPTKKEIDNTESMAYIDLVIRSGELSETESAVISTVKTGEMYVDDIIAGSLLPAPEVLSALTMLEIKGHILRRAGNRIVLNTTGK